MASRWLLALSIALASGLHTATARASMAFCDRPPELSTAQQDRLLRFAALVKQALEDTGQRAVLVARSGMDLDEMGVRYSHAGISLKDSANTPWSVRQLYFACDEKRPRLFDQGMSGFLIGLDPNGPGYISVVTLPTAQQDALAAAALDNRIALNLLSATYSANAYPFSTLFQNCNQWVIEMLATAFGHLHGQRDDPELRARAQQWLIDNDYQPSTFMLSMRPMLWASAFVPWVHTRDHPPEALDALRFKVSMPRSIEAFVQARVPGAKRTEFCLSGSRVVIRHGWESIPKGCEASPGDTVLTLD